jgi:hypothetical protein
MKLNFELRDWTELLIVDDDSVPAGSRAANAADVVGGSANFDNLAVQVWANYAVVSNEERVKMGKCPRDIVIEQVQDVQRLNFNPCTNPQPNYDVRLSHAVKALFWSVRNKTISSEHANYSSHPPQRIGDQTGITAPSTGLAGPLQDVIMFNQAGSNDPISNSSILYENTQRLNNLGSDFYCLVQPWYHSQRIPVDTGYHMYSYTLDLQSLDPQGSTNYGKLTNVSIQVQAAQAATDACAGVATILDTVAGVTRGPGNTALTPIADHGSVVAVGPPNYAAYTLGYTSHVGAGAGNTGLISIPYADEGAPGAVDEFKTVYDFIVRAVNHNVIRVSGGALGFPVL